MCNGLIHADGGCQCPAANKGQTAELQQPLNSAVFAVSAVQHGENTVQRYGMYTVPPGHHKTADTPVWAKESGDSLFVFFPLARCNFIHGAGIKVPASVFRNPDRDGFVFFHRQVPDDRRCRDKRNLMFSRASTEQNGRFYLLHLINSSKKRQKFDAAGSIQPEFYKYISYHIGRSGANIFRNASVEKRGDKLCCL